MAKTADRTIVSLAELRFKPANSNDAARAILAHHFDNVPRCSFAKDDGISQYLGSETKLDTFPTPPGEHAVLHEDVPNVQLEAPVAKTGFVTKLLRSGFALSVFAHAVVAFALVTMVSVVLPDDPELEGVISVSLIVEGSDADQRSSGEDEEVKAEDVKPVPVKEIKPVEEPPEKKEPVEAKPVEPVKQPELPKPVEAKPEEILKDIPMPELGADVPEILTATEPSEAKVDAPIKRLPVEEKIEPRPEEKAAAVPETPVEEKKAEPVLAPVKSLSHPVSKPREIKKLVEEKPEPKKEELKKPEEPEKVVEKKKPEKKEKPKERLKKVKGNRGKDTQTSKRGEAEASKTGDLASENSRGRSNNREVGNAARTNYRGLVQKKLQRAKNRVRSPGKGMVVVSFTITSSGSVSGLRIKTGSGKDALDAAALKIINSAAPFPPIPSEIGRKSLPISIPIQFK